MFLRANPSKHRFLPPKIFLWINHKNLIQRGLFTLFVHVWISGVLCRGDNLTILHKEKGGSRSRDTPDYLPGRA